MRITDERVEQVLPPNIKNSDLGDLEKRTLAALLHSLTISKGAQESGFLVIGNKKLFSVIGGRREYIMTALRTLEEYDLFKRVVGKSRVEGEKSEASEYHFNWDNIFKNPLKKKTSEELFSKFFKSLETPMGTPITTTTTITTSITKTTSTKTSTSQQNDTELEDSLKSTEELEKEQLKRMRREVGIEDEEEEFEGVKVSSAFEDALPF